MTRRGRTVVVAALMAASGMAACTTANPHRTPSASRAPSASAAADCSVTRSSGAQPPRIARLNFGSVLASSKVGWVGRGGLWVQLPSEGQLLAGIDQATGLYAAKFGWFRANPGQVSVSGRPLEGVPARFQADVGTVPEYGPTGFTPSILQFSRLGCWELTGALGKGRLTFVVRVAPMTPPP